MVILGIGLDLVEIGRFNTLYGDFDPDVLGRCFTTNELDAVGSGTDRVLRLAARFAAKEAVLKTIGGLRDGIALTDIDIVSDGISPPVVRVTGGALEAARERGVTGWHISVTHASQSAAAVALAYSDGPI